MMTIAELVAARASAFVSQNGSLFASAGGQSAIIERTAAVTSLLEGNSMTVGALRRLGLLDRSIDLAFSRQKFSVAEIDEALKGGSDTLRATERMSFKLGLQAMRLL